MNDISIPVKVVGPGSQPNEFDEDELDILQMPSSMDSYDKPILPEPEDVEHLTGAKNKLTEVLFQLQNYRNGMSIQPVNLKSLDATNLELVDQVLGEGEVSIIVSNEVSGYIKVNIQESVLAGVWRIRHLNEQGDTINDEIEVAAIPSLVLDKTFSTSVIELDTDDRPIPEGVCNAPPLIAEINDKIKGYKVGDDTHVINLTLLPQTEEDLLFLNDCLGQGNISILSRGYGNCRISSTATNNLWWVQYYNSQDKNILNSLEVTQVPEVACAAQEDIDASAIRLLEILEIY